MWALVTVGSFAWTYHFKPDYAMYLQRLILIFPVFKTIHTLIVAVNVTICKEEEIWDITNKYLVMGIISFETLFQTMLLTIILMISKVTMAINKVAVGVGHS